MGELFEGFAEFKHFFVIEKEGVGEVLREGEGASGGVGHGREGDRRLGIKQRA